MRRIAVSTLVSSLALAGLNVLAEPPKADPARAPIERAGKAFMDAFGRGDLSAVAAMYAEDAIAFPPESDMLKGRAAIGRFWENSRDMGVKSLEFEVVDVTSSGNLAAETGIATLHVQAAGAETTLKVKYVVVWKKQDGGWKLYRDIWNNLPAATPAAAPASATTPVAPTHH
jgi:uncharacterized protein (TIGR02246 family)